MKLAALLLLIAVAALTIATVVRGIWVYNGAQPDQGCENACPTVTRFYGGAYIYPDIPGYCCCPVYEQIGTSSSNLWSWTTDVEQDSSLRSGNQEAPNPPPRGFSPPANLRTDASDSESSSSRPIQPQRQRRLRRFW